MNTKRKRVAPMQIIGFGIFSHARRVTIFRTHGSIARVGIVSQRQIHHGLQVRVLNPIICAGASLFLLLPFCIHYALLTHFKGL